MSEIEPTKPIKPDKLYYIKKYSLPDYIQNPEVVKKINDEYIDFLKTFIDENDQLLDENEQLRTELRSQLRYIEVANKNTRIKWKTQLLQAIFALVTLTLIGFGISLITMSPPIFVGWLLIGCGIVVQLLALSLLLVTRPQGGNQ